MDTTHRQQQWSVGDLFAIRQSDGKWTVGQILDLMMPNVVTCAFYDIRFPDSIVPTKVELSDDKLITLAAVTREQLDFHVWRIIGHQNPVIERFRWPNEQLRNKGWIGAKMYDAAILEDFLEAYYALAPWDSSFDPEYFTKLLVSPNKKPTKLLYSRQQEPKT